CLGRRTRTFVDVERGRRTPSSPREDIDLGGRCQRPAQRGRQLWHADMRDEFRDPPIPQSGRPVKCCFGQSDDNVVDVAQLTEYAALDDVQIEANAAQDQPNNAGSVASYAFRSSSIGMLNQPSTTRSLPVQRPSRVTDSSASARSVSTRSTWASGHATTARAELSLNSSMK